MRDPSITRVISEETREIKGKRVNVVHFQTLDYLGDWYDGYDAELDGIIIGHFVAYPVNSDIEKMLTI